MHPHPTSPSDSPTQPLPNPRHESFARLQALGRSAKEAYAEAYRVHPPTASTRSSSGRLRARPEVIARIRHLQSHAAQAAVTDLREILEFLTRVKRTPIAQITPGSDLVRRIIRCGSRRHLRIHDKYACVKLAAKLQGFLRAHYARFETPTNPSTPGVLTEARRARLIAAKRAATRRHLGLPTSPSTIAHSRSTPPPLDPAQPLPNPRQEAFVRLRAAGQNGTQAYLAVYRTNRIDAKTNAPKLLARAGVSARLRHLQCAAASTTIMDLREILEFLTSVMRTPAGAVDGHSELVQRFDLTATGPTICLPSKHACVALLARLLGFLPNNCRVPA